MSQEPSDQDGQLYTLGLLERLRTQTGLAGAAFSDMHSRVDKLLREISNPNLHDIANMSYRVELWDKYALHIRWTVAAVGHIYIAQAAFDRAVKEWPDQRLTLRQGIRVIQDHDPERGQSR
jgi:hypothetical protein